MRAALAAVCLLGCTFPDPPRCVRHSDCAAAHVCRADGVCRAEVPVTQTFEVPAPPPIDLLFVLDVSGTMCHEQGRLADSFDTLLAQDGFYENDIRLAVTTTDMVPPHPLINPPKRQPASFDLVHPLREERNPACFDDERPGRPPSAEACADLPPVFDSSAYAGDPITAGVVIRCMLTMGVGYPAPQRGFEAMRTALHCDGPNAALFAPCCRADGFDPECQPTEATRFLRPEAHLVVVFVSDSDDCSSPATDPLGDGPAICRVGPWDSDGDGVPDAYGADAAAFMRDCPGGDGQACYRACGPGEGDDGCEWRRGDLSPVDEYADFLRGLKRSADQVSVLAIVGPRLFNREGYEVSFQDPAEAPTPKPQCRRGDPDWVDGLERCCPRGLCGGAVEPSCFNLGGGGVVGSGAAEPGRRYLELAERFGLFGAECDGDICPSVCGSDYFDSLDAAIEAGRRPLPLACLAEAPGCRVGGRSCATDEERADSANYDLAVKVDCGASMQTWCDQISASLTLDARPCPHGVGVVFDPPVPTGATVVVRHRAQLERATVTVGEIAVVAIPDGDPAGVARTLEVEAEGRVALASLSVDIRHPTRGDLTLRLRHGDVTAEVVRERGRSEDNIQATFLVEGFGGTSAAGDWVLEVSDGFPIDEGSLRAWSLLLEVE